MSKHYILTHIINIVCLERYFVKHAISGVRVLPQVIVNSIHQLMENIKEPMNIRKKCQKSLREEKCLGLKEKNAPNIQNFLKNGEQIIQKNGRKQKKEVIEWFLIRHILRNYPNYYRAIRIQLGRGVLRLQNIKDFIKPLKTKSEKEIIIHVNSVDKPKKNFNIGCQSIISTLIRKTVEKKISTVFVKGVIP